MQKLKKPTKAKNCPHRKRFDEVCDIIREALHVEHWEARYDFEKNEKGSNAYAEQKMYCEGRRIWIVVYDHFWGLATKEQYTTLIHEHIHAVMIPYDQMVHRMVDWSHETDRRWSNDVTDKGREHVVDHLTSVIYDLIADCFE